MQRHGNEEGHLPAQRATRSLAPKGKPYPSSDKGDFWDVMGQRVFLVVRAVSSWFDRRVAAGDSVFSLESGDWS